MSEPRDTRQQAASSGRRRELIVEGVTWTVREDPTPAYDRRSAPSLIFSCDTVVRRVRNFPEDWWQLPDAALFALSWTK